MMKLLLVFSFLGSPVFATGTFAKHDGNLLQLQGKVNADEKSIVDLIKEKNESQDPAKQHEIVAEIKKLMKSRRENIEKYNKEYYHVEYEHPGQMDSPGSGKKEEEKDAHGKKKESEVPEKKKNRYKRYDEKTIKEFEDEINKVLSDVYGNIKKKYNQ
ncbi:MAG: hypothetical protein V4596_08355 [Bdellovibrionota bacterium]